MKKPVSLIVLLLTAILAATPAFAETPNATLHASTVTGTVAGTVGQFDLTVPDQLVFRSAGKPDLTMPYAQIVEFSSRTQRTHQLGVLLTIVVGLLAPFERDHFLTISFHDNVGNMQMAEFEIAKSEPATMIAILETKARNACERREYGSCAPVAPTPTPARRPLTLSEPQPATPSQP